jgi:hypothetical protein
MEVREVNMNKPTPGPWRWNTAAGIYGANDKRCANVYVHGEINLPDSEMDANAALVVAAVNACFKVNPENPLAVAEGVAELVNVARNLWLKTAMIPVDWDNPEAKELSAEAVKAMDAIAAALAKIEAKS